MTHATATETGCTHPYEASLGAIATTAWRKRQMGALVDHLWRHCRGWERRHTIAHVRNILRKRGFAMSVETVQRLTKPLREAGVPIGSDDHPKSGGIYIATHRAELTRCLAQLDTKIDGALRGRDVLRKLARELPVRHEQLSLV